jgi:hypothetical protein
MTKKTTTTLLIATIYFLVFFAVLVYAYVSVRAEQVSFTDLSTTLATQTAKETAARHIAELSSTTAVERAELQDYFVPEKKIISFINEIEALARSIGITLQTTNLDLTPAKDKNPAVLKTGFTVSGPRDGVMTFMHMIESLPYHSQIPTMDIVEKEQGAWQGTVMLNVTISS